MKRKRSSNESRSLPSSPSRSPACATVPPAAMPARPPASAKSPIPTGSGCRPLEVVEDSRCPANGAVRLGRPARRAQRSDRRRSWRRTLDLELGKPQQVADGALTLVAADARKSGAGPKSTPAPIASPSTSRAGFRPRPTPRGFRRSPCRACGRIPRRSDRWRRSDSSARLKLAIMPGFLASSRQASSRREAARQGDDAQHLGMIDQRLRTGRARPEWSASASPARRRAARRAASGSRRAGCGRRRRAPGS